MPVPRPTTWSAVSPKVAAISAAAGVVLPIPMSPRISRSAPGGDLGFGDRCDRPAVREPVSAALSASARSIGSDGPMWYADTSAGRPSRSSSTPRSSTRSATPCCRARALAPATPAAKARTMAAVTARG